MEKSEQEITVLVIGACIPADWSLALHKAGFKVYYLDSFREGLQKLQAGEGEILILPTTLTEISLPAAIERLREIDAGIPVLLAGSDTATAENLRFLEGGVSDYLLQPLEHASFLFMLQKISHRYRLYNRSIEYRRGNQRRLNLGSLIGQSPQMQEIFETVKRLAAFKTTILVSGESGTGKELIARAIHYHSPRASGPFVPINCGAIPEGLIESELFGHKRGSFTDAVKDKRGLFEEAHGGTIFLDEVGDLPLHLQVKLLRVLQEQVIRRVGDETGIPIDTRIVAATNRDLEDDVMTGRFREDLFYRLNVVSVHLPPLRERQSDIPVLIEHFIAKHNKKLKLAISGMTPEALRLLTAYYWKGNIRELENTLERAMVLTDSNLITEENLPEHIQAAPPPEASEPLLDLNDDNLSVKEKVRALEVTLISRALKRTHGNRTHAARLLEISHRTLLYKLKEYDLS